MATSPSASPTLFHDVCTIINGMSDDQISSLSAGVLVILKYGSVHECQGESSTLGVLMERWSIVQINQDNPSLIIKRLLLLGTPRRRRSGRPFSSSPTPLPLAGELARHSCASRQPRRWLRRAKAGGRVRRRGPATSMVNGAAGIWLQARLMAGQDGMQGAAARSGNLDGRRGGGMRLEARMMVMATGARDERRRQMGRAAATDARGTSGGDRRARDERLPHEQKSSGRSCACALPQEQRSSSRSCGGTAGHPSAGHGLLQTLDASRRQRLGRRRCNGQCPIQNTVCLLVKLRLIECPSWIFVGCYKKDTTTAEIFINPLSTNLMSLPSSPTKLMSPPSSLEKEALTSPEVQDHPSSTPMSPTSQELPKEYDRIQVEAKEVRLSDMPPITLGDTNVNNQEDGIAELDIAEDLDNRPSKKAKISESGVLEPKPMSPTMSASSLKSECFDSIVPESDNDPLPSPPSPSSLTLSPVLPLHDVKEPDSNKEIKVDQNYNYLPQDYTLSDYDQCAHIRIESSSRKQLLVQIDGSSVLQNQLMCLLDEKEWVNDDVINAYICCIKGQIHVQNGNRVYFESPFVISLLKRDGDLGIQKDSSFITDIVKKYMEHDMIELPINTGNTHWYLAVVNIKKHEIQVLDALCWKFDRDDLVITDPYLVLAGPTRVVVYDGYVYFDAMLKVKASTEIEDTYLSLVFGRLL